MTPHLTQMRDASESLEAQTVSLSPHFSLQLLLVAIAGVLVASGQKPTLRLEY